MDEQRVLQRLLAEMERVLLRGWLRTLLGHYRYDETGCECEACQAAREAREWLAEDEEEAAPADIKDPEGGDPRNLPVHVEGPLSDDAKRAIARIVPNDTRRGGETALEPVKDPDGSPDREPAGGEAPQETGDWPSLCTIVEVHRPRGGKVVTERRGRYRPGSTLGDALADLAARTGDYPLDPWGFVMVTCGCADEDEEAAESS